MSKPERTYTNGEINVEWRPEKCLHCRSCVMGLPKVFDLNKRPWVNMDGASTVAIRNTVSMCPDGALSIVEVGAAATTESKGGSDAV